MGLSKGTEFIPVRDFVPIAGIDLKEEAIHYIALRIYVRTILKSGIDTITKAIKFIPPLPHPVLQHKPPMLDLVQVWRIRRQIPDLTSRLCYNFLNRLGVVETGIINDDDIPPLQLGY